MEMHVPFRRFAWIAAALWLPAALGGWATLFTQSAVDFYQPCLVLALAVCLVVVPLSWSDHVGKQTGRGCQGCLLFGLVVAVTGLALTSMGHSKLLGPLASALFYLVPVLMFSVANPEGLTLLMLLVQAFIAGGLAEGRADPQHRLLLGVCVPVLAFGLGLGASLVRRGLQNEASESHR